MLLMGKHFEVRMLSMSGRVLFVDAAQIACVRGRDCMCERARGEYVHSMLVRGDVYVCARRDIFGIHTRASSL